MRRFTPHASALPASVDATDCPYFEPHCEAPLYAGGAPLVLNLTLLDSARPDGYIVRAPEWRLRSADAVRSTARLDAVDAPADVLTVRFAYERRLSAWAGFVGVELSVAAYAAGWAGVVSGEVVVEIGGAPGGEAGGAEAISTVVVPIRARVVPTPPRHRRLLVDLYHSSAYPYEASSRRNDDLHPTSYILHAALRSGFFPTDDLSAHADEMMDLKGDHPDSSLRGLARELRAAGFFLEVQ